MSSDDGWTLAMACAEFERAGMPVDEARFRDAVIRVARIKRVGEVRKPPGSLGGRGEALDPIGRLQRVHAWIVEQDDLNEATRR